MRPDPLLTLLRLWAEGFVPPAVVATRLAAIPGVDESKKRLGLALLGWAAGPDVAKARELVQCLQELPAWPGTGALPGVLGHQLAIEIARLASAYHGQPPLALNLYARALRLMPELAPAWYYRAQLWQGLQRWAEAAADLCQAVRLQPDWPEARAEAVQALLMAGDGRAAQGLVAEGLAQNPESAPLWLLQGNVSHALGQLPAAERAWRRSLELDPAQAGTWSNLGLVCQQLLRPDEARSCYARALELDPGLAELWNNLATLQLDAGEASAAETSLGRCLQLLPGYYPAWVNRGLLAAGQGQNELARQYLQQARDLEPMRPEAWLEAAGLLLEAGREPDAWVLLRQGLARQGDAATAAPLAMMLGRAQAMRHERAHGEALMQRALAQPGAPPFWRFVYELGAAETWFNQPQAERQAYLEALAQRLQAWAAQPFPAPIYAREARHLPFETLWNLAYLSDQPWLELRRRHAACFAPAAERPPALRGDGPLRLGVVVTPGHEGIFLKLAGELLRVISTDRVTTRLYGDPERLSATGLPVEPLAPGPAAAASQLRAQDLELIYYWETGSDLLNFLLPLFQPAPVQFTSWGSLASSGQQAYGLQYYLGSRRWLRPEDQADYSETLLLMDELPVCASDPLEVAGTLPREALGLPAAGTLYACLQNPIKLNPELVSTFRELLLADPDAHLILMSSRFDFVNRALSPFKAVLEPVTARVHWREAPIPRPEYLNLLAVADIGLDSWPHAGGQTSHEALALGLPVLTLPGRAGHSRLTLARYLQLNERPDEALDPVFAPCVAGDFEDYRAKALTLSRNPALRQGIRAALGARRHRLLRPGHDSQGPAAQFAALLWEMARREGLRG